MTKDDSLNILSELSSIIDTLERKWERPQSEGESAIIQSLLNIRETVRKAHETQCNPDAQSMYGVYLAQFYLAQFCVDVSLYVGRCVYSSPAAQVIAFRYHGSFQRAENGEWLFLSRHILTSQEHQGLERDIEKLHEWMQGEL